jgi:hypothetical protein
LATKIAELQFLNREHVLMFRGQTADYRNLQSNTSLKPGILRSHPGERTAPDETTLTTRFSVLSRAEARLAREYAGGKMLGWGRLKRQRILRWAILQHYDVCPTPLLDVTQSLRIAASFASHDSSGEGYVFVLAVPNLSGAVTASAEAGIQIVRLSSVCPPAAVRPHIQEGYLLGEYPDMADYDQKSHYGHYEVDFGRRLLAKFRFNPRTFWSDATFPLIPKEALYPKPGHDPLSALTGRIKSAL